MVLASPNRLSGQLSFELPPDADPTVVVLPAVYEVRLSDFADEHLGCLVTAMGTTTSPACSTSPLLLRGDGTYISKCSAPWPTLRPVEPHEPDPRPASCFALRAPELYADVSSFTCACVCCCIRLCIRCTSGSTNQHIMHSLSIRSSGVIKLTSGDILLCHSLAP